MGNEKKRRGRLTVPRKEIAWFPVIDPDACNSCTSCSDFCPKGVFASGPDEGLRRRPKMTVANPYNCIVLCNKCVSICPAGAISLPDRADFEHFIEYID
ncbi:MAG: ferredoxin family protein [Candidatus Chlorobium antarcticum]|nr:ferredoxin family protein [Candidatus Chlorobium antarcticum]